MKTSLTLLGLASAAILVLSSSAQAQTYSGNGGTGFGGPVGNGSLSLSSDGTTLSGSITGGGNGQLYDELVIYIDSQPGGLTDTSTFTAFTQSNGDPDYLQQAAAGTDGAARSIVDFAPGFGANYAISLSPTAAQYGVLYSITSAGALDYIQSINLAPTGAAGPYTFSLLLSNIGITSPTGSFDFASTYLNAHQTTDPNTGVTSNNLYRSDETFGNTLTDTTNPANGTGGNNPGTDTVLVGSETFNVPGPSTWAMMLGGLGALIGWQYRRCRI